MPARSSPTRAAFDSARSRKRASHPSSSTPARLLPITRRRRAAEIYYRKRLVAGRRGIQLGERRRDRAGEEQVSRRAMWSQTGSSPGKRAATTRPEGTSRAVSPDRTVFEGGPAPWRPSCTCPTSISTWEATEEGKLWRLTPMVNWYLSDNIRFDLGLWVRPARPLQPRGPHSVLPMPTSVHALTAKAPASHSLRCGDSVS